MANKKHQVALFGELLMRLEAPRHLRFVQSDSFDVGYSGGEANAGALLSRFGVESYLIAAVPDNDLGRACTNHMQRYGLDVSYVQRRGARLGLFFLESGASHRATRVLYDRSGSSFSLLKPGDIPWEEALRGKDWFHFTGTAPALSEDLAELTLEGCCTAKDLGITVSCDVNYRSALWSVDAARRSMTRIVQNVDVLISNEEHARQVLGAPAATDGCTDPFDARCYEATMRYLREEFDLRAVALTIRAGETSNETTIAALLDDGIKISQSRKYFIRAIDRIGGGDAFTGALIYGLLQCRNSQDTVELAAAASCLKHSVHGDFCHASLDEVESLARTGPNGRVRR